LLIRRIGLVGAALLVIGQAFTRHRPPRRAPRGTGPSPSKFILGDLMWSVSSAVLVTLVFSSHVATDWIAGPPPHTPSADWSSDRIIDWYFGPINVPLADWSVTWRPRPGQLRRRRQRGAVRVLRQPWRRDRGHWVVHGRSRRLPSPAPSSLPRDGSSAGSSRAHGEMSAAAHGEILGPHGEI
jgi:hypothetical protein